jgi:hypothetical protein
MPAMVGAVQNDDLLVAVHLTFLTHEGRKSPLEPSKMMRGPVSGGAIKLLGEGRDLVVGEGIETSLSLYDVSLMRAGSRQVWAALSSSGMKSLRLPADPGTLWIGADGDRVGREAAQSLARRALALNWRVRISSAPEKLDWNDLMAGTLGVVS